MPTVPVYYTQNPNFQTWRGEYTNIEANVWTGEAPYFVAANGYVNNGDIYTGSPVTKKLITPMAGTGSVTFVEPSGSTEFAGAITYPDDEAWNGADIWIRYRRATDVIGITRVQAPWVYVSKVTRSGRTYKLHATITWFGGTEASPERLALIQVMRGGVVHDLGPGAGNFPNPAQWWQEKVSHGILTLEYSGSEDNGWQDVKVRATTTSGQIGGWTSVKLPPWAEFTIDDSQNPLFLLDASPSYDTDGQVVEYALGSGEWQESPIFNVDVSSLADLFVEDFDYLFQIRVRDNEGRITRSDELTRRVQARTPRHDSFATGANMIYRARHTNASVFLPSWSQVLFERRMKPSAGWQSRDYLPDHVDPSLAFDKATGDIYLLARDMTAGVHRLYRCTDSEHFLEFSMEPPWGEGFTGGRILHLGGAGFRSAALKRLEGGAVEVWFRGSEKGTLWPETGEYKPLKVHTFEPDEAGVNLEGRLINLGMMQDGSGIMFLDNGSTWMRHSRDGKVWSPFT